MTLLRNAMYNALLRKENVCCLCFEAVETNAIRIDDEVFLNENEISNNVQLSGVLAFIFGSDVGDLASGTVCKECATSAINCYIFIKKCKENSRHFQQAIENLDNCLQNATDPEQIQSCKSLFVSFDASNVAKEYYDYKRLRTKPSVILMRFKSLSSKKHAKYDLQNIQNEDDFDADIEAPIIKQDATKLKCEKETTTTHETDPIPRDLILHKDSKRLAYKCKSCVKTFKVYGSLRRHYIKTHAQTFKCSKCERSYGYLKLLETHLKTCRETAPVPRDLILHKDSKPSAFKCKSCLETFKEFKTLKRHYLRIHAPKKFKCSKCERSYASCKFLETHLKTCSGTPPISRDLSILHEDSEPSEYKCKSCLETFKQFRTLKRHYLRIHAPKTFKCSKCERSYGTYKFLETHVKTCTGRIPISRDLILHEDSKPLSYKCKSCPKIYKEFKILKDHFERVHAPKKFKCSKCECSYASYIFLKKHLKNSHVTCVCPVCGKTFNNKYSLKQHELGHILRLVCQKCKRVYKNKDSFRSHKESGVCGQTSRKSSKEGPFECGICDKRFSHNISLRAHIKSEHMA